MSRDVVLVCTGLTRRYGRVTALDGVDLAVGAGEILALVGPSGCGKSTALRLIAGLDHPDGGQLTINGDVVAGGGRLVPAERRRVGMVFQDHALFPHLSVTRNIAFGLDGRPPGERGDRVREMLDLMRLSHLAQRFPHELSGGEQQRVALARALAPGPALVLLDEPFAHLDHHLRGQVRTEVVAALRATGTTAVFVTHDQAEALAVGDRVAVLRSGRLEQVGAPDEVFHRPVNQFVAAFLGDADFLPAELDRGMLVTELGRVPAPDGPLGAGRIEVMTRPHEVTLRPLREGTAIVERAEFLGAFVLYTLRLPSGRTARSLQPHTVALHPGERVGAAMAHGHEAVVLVDDRAVTGQGAVGLAAAG